MPESTIALTKRDFSFACADGDALTYTFGQMPGDFNYTAPGKTIVDIFDNGTLSGVRLGDDQPCTWSLSIHLCDVGSASYITLPDIAEWGNRPTSYWDQNALSTLDGESDVEALDFTATIDLSKFGLSDKSMLFPDSIVRHSGADVGASGTYKVTGRTATALSPTIA